MLSYGQVEAKENIVVQTIQNVINEERITKCTIYNTVGGVLQNNVNFEIVGNFIKIENVNKKTSYYNIFRVALFRTEKDLILFSL